MRTFLGLGAGTPFPDEDGEILEDDDPVLPEKLDLSDEAKCTKALVDINGAVRRLQARGDLGAQISKLTADLTAVSQRLTELQNASQASVSTAGNDLAIYLTTRAGKPSASWRTCRDEDGAEIPGLLDTQSENAWVRELQRLAEQRTMCRALGGGMTAMATPATDRAIARHLSLAPEPLKRIFADSTNLGGEAIPDLVTPEFELELFTSRRVEALFQVINLPGKEYRIPFVDVGFRPYIKGGPTADDPGQYTSSTANWQQRSITATGLAVRAQIDEDAAEDAILPVIPVIRSLLVQALVDGTEDAILNGDSTSPHQDDVANWNIRSRWGAAGLGTATDHRRAWLGLRAEAFDKSNTTDQSAAKTFAGWLTARGKLDSPHGVEGSLVTVVSPEYYITSILGFAEVVTIEKFGPQATIISGQVAKMGGAPIIVSDLMSADLAATGLFTNSGAKTSMLIFNRDRYKMGVLRAPQIEVAKDITRGLHNAVATRRCIFYSLDSRLAAGKKTVHLSYNL